MKVQIQIIEIIIKIIVVVVMNDDFVISNLVLINNRRPIKNSEKLFNRISETKI